MGNEPRGLTEVCLATLEASGAGPSDGHLLRRYVVHRDQAAFAALVRRHGPMVLGLCRRITAHPHDAEDAFQATFLVLIRKAAAIRQPETIGNWLYGVAHRTARASRRRRSVRSVRETPWPGVPEPAAPVATADLDLAIVDEELRRLPDKYRTAIVLCDLRR
jgi:RNA polymerase sigma factor (sigma-70 family)